MTSSEQPKEYVITEEDTNDLKNLFQTHHVVGAHHIVEYLRSRPHPVPVIDFEIPTADRGDPIAVAYYRGKANGRIEGARKAREDVLNELLCYINPDSGAGRHIKQELEKLRHTTPNSEHGGSE